MAFLADSVRHVTRHWTPGAVFTRLALASRWTPGGAWRPPLTFGAGALVCEGQPVWPVEHQRRPEDGSDGHPVTGTALRGDVTAAGPETDGR